MGGWGWGAAVDSGQGGLCAGEGGAGRLWSTGAQLSQVGRPCGAQWAEQKALPSGECSEQRGGGDAEPSVS